MTGYSSNFTGLRNRRKAQKPNAVPRHSLKSTTSRRTRQCDRVSTLIAEGYTPQSVMDSLEFEPANCRSRSQRTDHANSPYSGKSGTFSLTPTVEVLKVLRSKWLFIYPTPRLGSAGHAFLQHFGGVNFVAVYCSCSLQANSDGECNRFFLY